MSKSKEIGLFSEERKHIIVNLMNSNHKTTVASLCSQFSVSPVTIRKDLRQLEKAGYLMRTHGGAISNIKVNYEQNYYQKATQNIQAKKAIARKALQYVKDGDTIALDSGTSTLELAKLLFDYHQITVITNDLQIAALLEKSHKINLLFVGDVVRHKFFCTAGSKAVENLKDLKVDKTFLAANGMSIETGISTPNIEIGLVKSTMIEIANFVILLLDSSKFGKYSFTRFADFNHINLLITDSGADEKYIEKLNQMSLKVEVCD